MVPTIFYELENELENRTFYLNRKENKEIKRGIIKELSA